MNNDAVLITGVAGFIGFHTAQRLLAQGRAVVGVDNFSPYYDVQLKRDRLAQLQGQAGFTFVELN
ncbi:MAG TPA: GDP-mannose 4,6-dehydratase, partial [Micavibrio sp.]